LFCGLLVDEVVSLILRDIVRVTNFRRDSHPWDYPGAFCLYLSISVYHYHKSQSPVTPCSRCQYVRIAIVEYTCRFRHMQACNSDCFCDKFLLCAEILSFAQSATKNSAIVYSYNNASALRCQLIGHTNSSQSVVINVTTATESFACLLSSAQVHSC
jgi:hypothetical protein